MSSQPTRRILIQKGPNGLGFSVKGGGDVGLPLIVSRVESGGCAVGFLKVGMEISAVNGISLEGLPHYAAVEVLRRTRSPVMLFVRDETPETVAIVKNLLASGSGGYSSNSGTLRSCYSKSETGSECKFSRSGSACDTLERAPSQHSDSNYVELYDLRTVKRFVKEILHQPKEVFAKKLAWEFPPVALGKFHKWLLSKLQRFDCEAPQHTANCIFDAFSQSLYLSRAIYDLVHLIRTLMAMERAVAPTASSEKETSVLAVEPATPSPVSPSPCLASAVQESHPNTADLHKPQVMAAFLAEINEFRAQLAKVKEGGDASEETQAHITQQDAQIKALREKLSSYEARIAALTNGNGKNKDTDLGTFFRENFKRIKNKTMKRRQSLGSEGKICPKTGSLSRENVKDNCYKNGLDSPNLSVKSRDSDVTISRVKIVTSTPTMSDKREGKCDKQKGGKADGEKSHLLQVGSDDSIPRDRIGSSDDDYVQMNGLPSPIGTLPKSCDPLQEEETPVRPISRDYKRSSVSSSNSKSSIESIKLKHKQTIMIGHQSEVMLDDQGSEVVPAGLTNHSMSGGAGEHVRMESNDYMTMERGGVGNVARQFSRSGEGDYVEADMLPPTPGLVPNTGRIPITRGVNGGESASICLKEGDNCDVTRQEDVGVGSDTISNGTLRADINVKEERQINATQVSELAKDVDSIMVDVQTLHRMEQRLIQSSAPPHLKSGRGACFAPVTNTVVTSSPTPVMTSSMGRAAANGGMVTAHEVPIYAKVERIASPPPPRIRPFSFGEASNSSNTSQNELSRHEVCPKTRKTSLTSNGSSVELKSDYSSDRPSSFNTSLTTSTEQGDRFSRVSSDVVADDQDHRISVISDVKSDGVFSPTAARQSHSDPLRTIHDSLSRPSGRTNHRAPPLQRAGTEPHKRDRTSSSSAGFNVSFDLEEDLEDCVNKEVGEDFFLRGKKDKKSSGFKKMLSFGKGKKKRSLSSDEERTPDARPGPRQPDIRNPDCKRAQEDYHPRSSSLGSLPGYHRSRDLSGTSSSSDHSSRRHSGRSSIYSADGNISSDVTRNICDVSIRNAVTSGNSSPCYISGGELVSPIGETQVDEIRSLVGELETRIGEIISSEEAVADDSANHNRDSKTVSTGSTDLSYVEQLEDSALEPELITLINEPEAGLNQINNSSGIIYPNSPDIGPPGSDQLIRKTSKGGFYDELGVKINFDEIPVSNEEVIDLENETIIDLDGEVIEDTEELQLLRAQNQRISERASPDSNIAAKVDKELQINTECSRMVDEIDRITSPPLQLVKQSDLRNKTPSPSFSEIDILLGDITAELDDFGF